MRIKKIRPAKNAYKSPLLIKNLFEYSTTLNPENEIIYRDVSRYNYRDFQKRVKKYANMLENMGLKGGETIAVMDYDSHRFLEAYFAIPMTGNVLHMINWRLSSEQILYTINHAEDLVIIAHADFLPVLEHFAGSMPSLKYLIICKDYDSEIHSEALHIYGEYEELMNEASDEYEFEDFDEDAVATTFYSTGTTGDPKGVFFTHRQLVLHTYNLAATLGFSGSTACRMTSNDVYLPLTPMFHVHAWGFPFLATAYSLKQVYVGKFTPDTFIELFKKEKPTFSHCVPTILQMILDNNNSDNLDLSKWKVVTGGTPMTRNLAKRALEKGVDVIVGYGMSETCPIIALTHIDPKYKNLDLDHHVEMRIRTGVPPLLSDIKIINDNGQTVQKDDVEQGEIIVRAPWLTQGYYKEPKQGLELWEGGGGGYLHTGDIATINPDNSIRITDRIKDIIKIGGEWISSVQLENIINSHESVSEVAVVGIPDEKWSESPFALIVLKPNMTLSQEELKNYLKKFVDSEIISKWAIPQTVEFVNEIPKTSVGKIDKKLIRNQFSGNV
ncbi:MAG: fatty acid--CoA ligase [Spirochaetaceae bacterium]|jgi:fatty-acyl-CoA synthase|nr:fatty acid--CoA ligase [Spirochaetaceae bacterium]